MPINVAQVEKISFSGVQEECSKQARDENLKSSHNNDKISRNEICLKMMLKDHSNFRKQLSINMQE
jgi:hypothetical protein